MSKSTPKVGTKITPEEAAKLDPAKRGVLVVKPLEQEVEGQYLRQEYTQCPWCGHIGLSIVDTDRYNWYTCGNCVGSFRA